MGQEIYLDLEDFQQKNRKRLCAFRTSCHDLEIERGPFSTPPKPPEERICNICQNFTNKNSGTFYAILSHQSGLHIVKYLRSQSFNNLNKTSNFKVASSNLT